MGGATAFEHLPSFCNLSLGDSVMPRINRIKKSLKEHRCAQCGRSVPKGEPYQYIEPRYGPKRVHCSTCRFRPSHLTSSEKLGELYSIQEELSDLSLSADNLEDAKDAIQEVIDSLDDLADRVREVSGGYEESADSQEEYFPGSPKIDEMREKSQAAEEFADEIESLKGDLESFFADLDNLEEPSPGEDGEPDENLLADLLEQIGSILGDASGRIEDASSTLSV
jgi:hypothetical protein